MSSPIDIQHDKITTKFKCLEDIISIITYVGANNRDLDNIYIDILPDLKKIICKLESQQLHYHAKVSDTLLKYNIFITKNRYIGEFGELADVDVESDNNILNDLQKKYKSSIASQNLLGHLDDIYTKIMIIYTYLMENPDFRKFVGRNPFCEYMIEHDGSSDSVVNATMSHIPDDSILSEIKEGFDRVNDSEITVSDMKCTQVTIGGRTYNTKSIDEMIENIDRVFESTSVILSDKREIYNICDVCESDMTVFPESSEMVCNAPDCGRVLMLYGMMFEDNNLYNQNNHRSRTKRHDENGHCAKWINKIQANEDFVFPQHVIDSVDKLAVREYTRDGQLRPMYNLKCTKVREWLKILKYSDYYDNAPLLRKIVTGLHGEPVVPPRLTLEEQREVLIEYSLCMRIFEKLIKDPEILRKLNKEKIRNKFYYPDILWRILNVKLKKNDPRRASLLECIHLQSDTTLKRNDIVWKGICDHRGHEYTTTKSNF